MASTFHVLRNGTQSLQGKCAPIQLPASLAAAVQAGNIHHLRIYVRNLLLADVDLRKYPQAVQGDLFTPFRAVNSDFAFSELRVSKTKVTLQSEPSYGPPVLVETSKHSGPREEFLVREWDGRVDVVAVYDDSLAVAVGRTTM